MKALRTRAAPPAREAAPLQEMERPRVPAGAPGSGTPSRSGRFLVCFALTLLLCGLPAQAQSAKSLNINALTPPSLELMPGPHYWPRVRIWQGIPGITIAPNGRLWATWYTGLLGEGKGQNYAVLVTSDDDGKTWSKPVAVFDPSRNFLNADTGDPMLWTDPSGKMWWFVNRSMKVPNDVTGTCWGFCTDDPNVAKPVWHAPVLAGRGGGTLNKPCVLADGSWLHLFDCRQPKKEEPSLTRGAHVYRFAGYGKPFADVGCAVINESVFAEHMVVERKDKTLWMLARANTGIAQAESKDGGKTWIELAPFTQSFNVNTRFFFRRLASGNLLLVANDHPKARSNMTAMLSKDEGKTWPHKLVLDERESVSYPDGVESQDGCIYIVYDRGRYKKDMQEILLARITEADIEAGNLVNPRSTLKHVINRLADEGGGVHFDGETTKMREAFAKLFPDSLEAKKQLKAETGEKEDLLLKQPRSHDKE